MVLTEFLPQIEMLCASGDCVIYLCQLGHVTIIGTVVLIVLIAAYIAWPSCMSPLHTSSGKTWNFHRVQCSELAQVDC